MYEGERREQGDHLYWHRKRTEYTLVYDVDLTSLGENTVPSHASGSWATGSKRDESRWGYLKGAKWSLLGGDDWKGSKKLSRVRSTSGLSSVKVLVPGGSAGQIYMRKTTEEWFERIQDGKKFEERRVNEETSELIGVLVPNGYRFDPQSGEVSKITESSKTTGSS